MFIPGGAAGKLHAVLPANLPGGILYAIQKGFKTLNREGPMVAVLAIGGGFFAPFHTSHPERSEVT
jgi:hypothetical protein